MGTWSDSEIRALISLWPTSSATEIANRLNRPRWAVSAKARSLHKQGLFDGDIIKYFEVPPPARRFHRMTSSAPQADLNMRPCSLLELDETRCRWPLGDIEMVAFCGGVTVRRGYCAHHLWRATGNGLALTLTDDHRRHALPLADRRRII